MRVLITGAKGFVGRNLVESLNAIGDGKDRRPRFQPLLPLEVFEFDFDGTAEELLSACSTCDFVVHLAGVNRPSNGDFSGNCRALSDVIAALEASGNRCPVLLSSSIQATLKGRFSASVYGKSKLDAEVALRSWSATHGNEVLIYRFPNIFGKWCRPRYNSAVATFCDAIANGREYVISDPSIELELLYVDDLVEEILIAMLGEPHRCRYEGLSAVSDQEGDFCYVPVTYSVTLGEIVSLLESFKVTRETLGIPDLTEDSFSKKLYSTYLSYLNVGSLSYELHTNTDKRGSFTEFLHTPERGQVSVNVSKPGVTKGNHWHHSKLEKFLVVSGRALIRERRIGVDIEGNPYPVDEYIVCGSKPTVVEMPPGHTHSITNLSDTDELVTIMWANERFDKERPDTFFEEV